MDRIEAMRTFARVAELGSFAAVAKQQGVARSVVTRLVAALEEHLSTKLIARSTRRLSLTSAGADYLERCRVILNLVDAAESGVAADRHAPRGAIRLSLPLSYGRRTVAPLLLDFARRYPEVNLDIDFADRRSKLIEEGIDLAIRITARLEPGDVTRRLGTGRMFLVASPDYFARHGEPRHPRELADHECLVYTSTALPGQWEFLVEGRMQRFPVRARLQSSSGEMLLEAAAAGFGITLTPEFLAQDLLAAGSIVPAMAEFPCPELGIHVVLPGNRHVPHRVRVLIDYLSERLAPGRPR
jgi:DNA-binding transcriptional LysR family regulator